MQSGIQIKTHSIFSTLAGVALAGVLSACGGGGSEQNLVDPPADNPNNNPPVTTTSFSRLGLDVQLFGNTPSDSTGHLLKATVDSDANITFSNSDPLPDQPVFNYNFTFPSGLPGGSVSGNLFQISNGNANKEIYILTPGATKNVQNVFWRNKDTPTLFGIGLAGYRFLIKPEAWPTSGTATYAGKAFQYIIDSNAQDPAKTTYALYTSEITALVDYSGKAIAIDVTPNPTLINTIGDPAVVNADPNQFSANYKLATSIFSPDSTFSLPLSSPPSGLKLPFVNNALAFFGNNAEELGGFVRYSGDVTTPEGVMTRDQFISFALVKQ